MITKAYMFLPKTCFPKEAKGIKEYGIFLKPPALGRSAMTESGPDEVLNSISKNVKQLKKK